MPLSFAARRHPGDATDDGDYEEFGASERHVCDPSRESAWSLIAARCACSPELPATLSGYEGLSET